MRRSSNLWHEAIFVQLRAADGPLVTDQIWRGMIVAGFQHASAKPRSTLCARLAELVQMKKLSRVGPSTYQITAATP